MALPNAPALNCIAPLFLHYVSFLLPFLIAQQGRHLFLLLEIQGGILELMKIGVSPKQSGRQNIPNSPDWNNGSTAAQIHPVIHIPLGRPNSGRAFQIQ